MRCTKLTDETIIQIGDDENVTREVILESVVRSTGDEIDIYVLCQWKSTKG